MEISLTNLPIDSVVIVLVILAGLFQKKYLADLNISGAWKTLAVSTIFTVAYVALMALAGKYTKDLPLKCFFSFVTATSLYELFLKNFLGKYFPDSTTKAVIALLISLSMISPAKAAQPYKRTEQEALASYYAHLTKAQQDSFDFKNLQEAQTAYMQAAMPLAGLLLSVLICAILIVALGIIWMKEQNETLVKPKL